MNLSDFVKKGASTMRLSEAIRLGAMMRPQGFGHLYSKGRTCAFGAAYDAVGIGAENVGGEDACPCWPWVMLTMADCPVCGDRQTISCVVTSHLNDCHGWTRERIAGWVATIEPQDAVEPEPVDQTVAMYAVVQR